MNGSAFCLVVFSSWKLEHRKLDSEWGRRLIIIAIMSNIGELFGNTAGSSATSQTVAEWVTNLETSRR
jgi:hypothetical protein